MNTHPDIEDKILRVKWMTRIANDLMEGVGNDDGATKLAHVVRATMEEAERLAEHFYGRRV